MRGMHPCSLDGARRYEPLPWKRTPPPGVVLLLLGLLLGLGLLAALTRPDRSVPVNLGPGKAEMEFGPDSDIALEYDEAAEPDTIAIHSDYRVELVRTGLREYELRFYAEAAE